MPRVRKPKPKPDLHPMCAAVRSLRAKMRLSQEEMALKVGIAPMTLSRFERGAQIPKDMDVLVKLRNVCQGSFNFVPEFMTFQRAIAAAIEMKSPYEIGLSNRSGYSPEQWELMQCARIAAIHFPKEAEAMRKAAGEALRLVKQVIRATDFSVPLGDDLYCALEQGIDDLVRQTAFERLKEERDEESNNE